MASYCNPITMPNRHQPLNAPVARDLNPPYRPADSLRHSNTSPLRESMSSHSASHGRHPYHVASQYMVNKPSLPVSCYPPANLRHGSRSISPPNQQIYDMNPTHQMSVPIDSNGPIVSPRLKQSLHNLSGISPYSQKPLAMSMQQPLSAFDGSGNTALLKTEIELLNKRLDAIDSHCREFTRLATEKAKLEDNLQNLAYLHMLDQRAERAASNEKREPMPRQSDKQDSHYAAYQPITPYETSAKHRDDQRGLDEIRQQSPLRSAFAQSQRDPRNRAQQEQQAQQEYEDELQKLEQNLKNYQQKLQQRDAFGDTGYLDMVQNGVSEDEKEEQDQYERRQSPQEQHERHVSPGDPYRVMNDNTNLQYRHEPIQMFSDRKPRVPYHHIQDENDAYQMYKPLNVQQQHSEPVTRQQMQRNTSPIKDMNYFDGINTIRSERKLDNQEHDENVADCRSLTRTILQRTRENEAARIQQRFYQTPGKRGRSAKGGPKSKQHDEFAVLNFYQKVSKYDLDRANLNIRQAWTEKQNRRVENAKAKREMLNNQGIAERHLAVANKVKKIQEVCAYKDQVFAERKARALQAQEKLRNFLAEQAAQTPDEKPLSYASDRATSAFRSVNQSRTANNSQNTIKPITEKGSIIANELKGSVLSQKSAERKKSKPARQQVQSPSTAPLQQHRDAPQWQYSNVQQISPKHPQIGHQVVNENLNNRALIQRQN